MTSFPFRVHKCHISLAIALMEWLDNHLDYNWYVLLPKPCLSVKKKSQCATCNRQVLCFLLCLEGHFGRRLEHHCYTDLLTPQTTHSAVKTMPFTTKTIIICHLQQVLCLQLCNGGHFGLHFERR